MAPEIPEASEEVRQVPLIEKQPAVRLMPFPNVLVPLPVTASALVVAPVAVILVATRLVVLKLVEVALVIVAFVPNRLVNVPRVAESTDAKNDVEVLLVLVLFNRVMFWKVVEDVKTF